MIEINSKESKDFHKNSKNLMKRQKKRKIMANLKFKINNAYLKIK
jgi:hypothetical protein